MKKTIRVTLHGRKRDVEETIEIIKSIEGAEVEDEKG